MSCLLGGVLELPGRSVGLQTKGAASVFPSLILVSGARGDLLSKPGLVGGQGLAIPPGLVGGPKLDGGETAPAKAASSTEARFWDTSLCKWFSALWFSLPALSGTLQLSSPSFGHAKELGISSDRCLLESRLGFSSSQILFALHFPGKTDRLAKGFLGSGESEVESPVCVATVLN